MEIIEDKAELALQMARTSRKVLEERLTKTEFVKATTSTFLFASWRKGSSDNRKLIEDQLEAFQSEDDVVEQIKMLEKLARDCMGIRDGSDKFTTAVDNVRKDAYELIDHLKETKEYKQHLQEKEEKERKEREEAERKEAERIEGLKDLTFSGRVDAFKERYGTSGTLDTLLDGIEEGGMAKLAANYKKIGFTYSMKSVDGKALITGRTDGDCSTVSKAMAMIAREILTVTDAKVASCDDMLANTTAKTIDGAKAPNGLDAAFWVFQNHFWVESSSGNFDPLFGGALDKSSWNLRTGARDDKALKLTYEEYGSDFKIVYLLGDGGLERALLGNVTETMWDTHCEKADVADVDFAGFKLAMGI